MATASGRLGTPPGWRGARRPEKRVTARSKDPQKKLTGLALPRKSARNRLMTRCASTSDSQNQRMAAASYASCSSSSANGIASGTSFGTGVILASIPRSSRHEHDRSRGDANHDGDRRHGMDRQREDQRTRGTAYLAALPALPHPSR